MARRRLSPGVLFVLVLASLGLLRPALADGGLPGLEREYQAAIRRVLPATVLVAARGATPGRAGSSSGVIVAAEGLILSDGDAGVLFTTRDGQRVKEWTTDVEVRIPDPAGGAARRYPGRVLGRDLQADTSLIAVLEPPPGGFPSVPPARSEALAVGDLVFALGSSFDDEGKMLPTLTAGIVSAVVRRGAGGGREALETVFTSAAINEGVNGGPLVDLSGRLVGTVSTYMNPDPREPHQFLGKVIPMDRILAAHGTLVAGRRLVRLLAGDRDRQGREHPLEVAFHAAAERAWPVVVSLDVQRRRPVSARVPLDEGAAVLPRHQGPVTGFLLSRDGEIVTSLYGLTNVGSLVEPLWRAPEGAGVEEGLGDVVAVTAHLAGGHAVPARILGHDARLGVVLLRADLPPALAPRLPNTLVPAPASAFERGRFVLALGNPYGAARPADPLLAAGILSKHHPEDVAAAWRGQWQTDAPGLDTNAGGPAVDLEGRLLGMLTLWHPAKHGRNSGIAFLVPLERIRAALPALRAGAGPRPGLLGVRFAAGIRPVVEDVEPGSGAGRAGLRKGDVVLRIDREAVVTVADAVAAVRFRYSGETVRVTVERGGQEVALLAELGER